MAEEEIQYTIPSDGSNDGSSVSLFVTYDPNSQNADGSFTVTAASGTYQALDTSGNVIATSNITGLGNFGQQDQDLFLTNDPMQTPIVDRYGITFQIDNQAISNDGHGNVNFFDNFGPTDGSTPTDSPAYLEDTQSVQPATSVVETAVSGPVACFVSGTLIRGARGDVAVENLAVGDLVVSSSGQLRSIVWIGHRSIDCTKFARRDEALPIRITPNAFGLGLPARDLYLSPGHPVLVGADEDLIGGHLIPIMCLINDTSIARVQTDRVTYWHIELDAHDILYAEGLPAESYFDWGDRAFFTEDVDHALQNPDYVVSGLAGRCRPVALDGPVVETERRRLDAIFIKRLACACAWPDENSFNLFD